jgi:hypothetical protein
MDGVKAIVVACLALLTGCAPRAAAPAASPALPPEWSVREAAGLRIAAPAAWLGPQVLPALESTGPRAWVVFRDPSGAEAITIMTWRDATASSLAASQFASELPKGDPPRQLTLVEGPETRTVVAMSGYAQWSDPSGAGTYECRYLYVQVDPTLVANVIACGRHVRGSSTPAADLRRTQEQVALRLGVAGGQP